MECAVVSQSRLKDAYQPYCAHYDLPECSSIEYPKREDQYFKGINGGKQEVAKQGGQVQESRSRTKRTAVMYNAQMMNVDDVIADNVSRNTILSLITFCTYPLIVY